MKKVVFMGDSLARIRAFPTDARQDAGFQIDKVQREEKPDDWKPMKTIGPGVREIRIKNAGGQYRVIYLMSQGNAVYVLHAFPKKTQQTRKSDIDLARTRKSLAGNKDG